MRHRPRRTPAFRLAPTPSPGLPPAPASNNVSPSPRLDDIPPRSRLESALLACTRWWGSFARLPLLLAPAVLLACGADAGPRTPADIVVAPNLPRVPMGGTSQLTATVVDADGRAIAGEPVTFESSDPAILTVGESGLLTSVGPLGTSIISAASGSVTTEVEAKVVLGPSGIFVTPSSLALHPGDDASLAVTVTDESGDSIPDAEVLWQTSDAAVVVITNYGGVTAGEPGTATITASSGELSREVPVTVSPP